MKPNPRAILEAWRAFWFEPVSTASLAVFRIVFGVIALAWSISLLPELSPFFTKGGILPKQPAYGGDTSGAWGLLGIFPSKGALIVLVIAMMLGSLSLIFGVFSQLGAAVVFLGTMSLQRRNPFVFNAGDELLRILAFYLIFAPTAAALSAERFLRNRKEFWTFPLRAPWALRLIQIQFSVLYLMAVWTKVQGITWNNGTAVSYALRIEDLTRLPVPSFITDSTLISNLFTFGTLALELSLAILVWNGRLRPWVLLAGLSLHLGIEYSIRVGFYGLAITSMYLIWVSPERMEAVLTAVRRRIEGSRLASPTRVASETRSPGG
jgi:vitamin K-dependent gamma-carboxylase-like protein